MCLERGGRLGEEVLSVEGWLGEAKEGGMLNLKKQPSKLAPKKSFLLHPRDHATVVLLLQGGRSVAFGSKNLDKS